MTDLKILGIDTSGKIASVAITDGDRLLWEKSVYTRLTHSQVILPMVKQALEETELDFSSIDCVAVANGPGSYTGLRIGIGAVKGMCMGEPHLKCAGISTLLSLAYNCQSFEGKIITVMRARPKIVYFSVFKCENGKIFRLCEDKVCGEEEILRSVGSGERIMLVGDCAAEIKAEYFDGDVNVLAANPANVLQRASSLCLAAEEDPSLIKTADKLEVSYLQATKAEKDKAHR